MALQFLVYFTLVMIVVPISSVIFPRLNLQLVIGYLIGGILLGPAIIFLPTIRDTTPINFFADPGIILLMFALGLEFNLRRLRKVVLFAIVAGAIEIGIMLTVGYTLGQMMGWSQIESIFLGAVMSTSSTALITMLAYPLIRCRSEGAINLIGTTFPAGEVQRLDEIERLREGVRKRLSTSSVRSSEARRQLMMIFIDMIIIITIVLASNTILLFRESITS